MFGNQNSKIYSVFVKHPEGIDTRIIQNLLQECGNLYGWKPQIDPSTGSEKNFGFAEYADMASIARAVRILSPIYLPDKQSTGGKQLMVRVDKSTMTMLDVYNKSNVVNAQDDEITRQKVNAILINAFGETIVPKDSASEFLDSFGLTDEQILKNLDKTKTLFLGFNPGFGSGYEALLISWA